MLGNPNRPNFHTLTPYLMVVDVEPLVEFLVAAFDARETYRTRGEAGGWHIELQIGDSMLMVGGGNNTVADPIPAALFMYIDNVDQVYAKALEAGAQSMMPPTDGMFDEERGAGIIDPLGNSWFIGRYGPQSKHYTPQ